MGQSKKHFEVVREEQKQKELETKISDYEREQINEYGK